MVHFGVCLMFELSNEYESPRNFPFNGFKKPKVLLAYHSLSTSVVLSYLARKTIAETHDSVPLTVPRNSHTRSRV